MCVTVCQMLLFICICTVYLLTLLITPDTLLGIFVVLIQWTLQCFNILNMLQKLLENSTKRIFLMEWIFDVYLTEITPTFKITPTPTFEGKFP